MDDIIVNLKVNLTTLDDISLVHIRNRVMWECKRRIAEDNNKLRVDGNG